MRAAALAITLLLGGCSTAGDLPIDVAPEITVRPDDGLAFLIDRGGTFNSMIEVEITNRASTEIRLVRLEIQTFGAPYTIRQPTPNVGMTFEPGQTRSARVPIVISSPGGLGVSDEPTMLRTLLVFHTDSGSFRRLAQFRLGR